MSLRSREPVPPVRDVRDEQAGHSAVRVIPKQLVPAALAEAANTDGTGDGRSDEPTFPTVVRPARFEDVRDVVDRLRAHRPVVLELDRLQGAQLRRRALDVAAGIAYALESSMSGVDSRPNTFLLDPAPRALPHRARVERVHVEPAPRLEPGGRVSVEDERAPLCVLCDLRHADHAYEPPLDMVILRDGARVHSPQALVCSHCRDTIRHWRFMLGWCPECERWGRRGVMSACGIPYGS